MAQETTQAPTIMPRRRLQLDMTSTMSGQSNATLAPNDTPDPHFILKPQTNMVVRLHDKKYENADKGRCILIARAENGHRAENISIAGPYELYEILKSSKNPWLSLNGKFVRRKDKERAEYTFEVKDFVRGWPRFRAATIIALRDIFGVTIHNFKIDQKSKDLIFSRLEDLAKEPDLMKKMMAAPDEYFRRLGVSESMRMSLLRRWLDATGPDRIYSALRQANIPEEVARRILEKWKDKVHEVLEKDPYLIVSMGAKFTAADHFAEDLGHQVENEKRVLAFIDSMLSNLSKTGGGSTIISHSAVIEYAISHGFDPEDLNPASIEELVKGLTRESSDSNIIAFELDGVLHFGYKETVEAELKFADWISRRLNKFREFKRNSPSAYRLAEKMVERVSSEEMQSVMRGKKVDPYQLEAVIMANIEPVMILTGGPGTGKTTTTEVILNTLRRVKKDKDIILCAPTGRAASRMTEVLNTRARTLHSQFKFIPTDDGAMMVKGEKLKPGSVVIIDEFSMCDSIICGALADMMTDDTTLIIVGDDGQIEPVGGGKPMADLLNSGRFTNSQVPRINLVNIHRSAEHGAIAHDYKKIRYGQQLEIKHVSSINDVNSGNWGFIDTSSYNETVLSQFKSILASGGKIEDIVTLCHMKAGKAGTIGINNTITDWYNPNGIPYMNKDTRSDGMKYPRIGDRVMIRDTIKSEHVKGRDDDVIAVNGDVGKIVGCENRKLKVLLDGQTTAINIPYHQWTSVELAYACTIHKYQGSQCKNVILPIDMEQAKMLERRITGTGWSRAQEKLLVVGDEDGLRLAIDTDKSQDRLTLLKYLLNDKLHPDPLPRSILAPAPIPIKTADLYREVHIDKDSELIDDYYSQLADEIDFRINGRSGRQRNFAGIIQNTAIDDDSEEENHLLLDSDQTSPDFDQQSEELANTEKAQSHNIGRMIEDYTNSKNADLTSHTTLLTSQNDGISALVKDKDVVPESDMLDKSMESTQAELDEFVLDFSL